ncbi:MAG: hypothetical protein DCC55_11050 [Chloroflexi bacterium]|nr:MAG: hypothetical protein DCC55_11050 [Chloroflexota bacterium]
MRPAQTTGRARQLRQRLLELLASLVPAPEQTVPASGIPFASVQVDAPRCSGCGLCARFCPTGALDFATAEETFRLQFQTAICLDCNICVVACPEDAVQLSEMVSPSDLTEQAPVPLVEGILTRCVDCGALTARHGHHELPARCYSCRQGAGVVRSLRDEAGLMADLLNRIAGAAQLPEDR